MKDRVGFEPVPPRSTAALLADYSKIVAALNTRKIIRSSNVTGDYAEYLFCQAFGWARENNSAKGYDAKDERGTRYQIKGRRYTATNHSRQMGALRELNAIPPPFDQFAGVLLDEDFRVLRAVIAPFALVRAESRPVARSNSWRFVLRDRIWDDARDVTAELRAVQLKEASATLEDAAEILSPLEQAAEECSGIFDRLMPDDKRALAVRLVALGALHEGDLGYADQVAEQARDTVHEFLANATASQAKLHSYSPPV